jgi:ABC-2 type transport system permease protein
VVGIVLNVAKAIVYREFAWFKRFLSDYVVLWILPLLFSLGAVFLPASLSSPTAVVKNMGMLYGIEMDLKTAYSIALMFTGVINVVAVTISDVMQTLFAEFRFMEVGIMILEATRFAKYIIINAVLRPLIMTPLVTAYMAPLLLYLNGVEGLLEFLIVEAILMLTSVALGLYSTIFAVPLIFHTNVSRPWTITSVLTPAILAGAGTYIPIELVPQVLRLVALTTPVPETCKALYTVASKGFPQALSTFGAILTFSTVLYIAVSGLLSKRAEVKVRRG